MEHIEALSALIEVAPDSTVSRTVLKAEGTRVVLFAFDAGQELTEHRRRPDPACRSSTAACGSARTASSWSSPRAGWSTSGPGCPTRSWRCSPRGWS